jgi:hypothetical protein
MVVISLSEGALFKNVVKQVSIISTENSWVAGTDSG